MGDIKKITNKYSTPRHPWERARIEEEKKVLLEYGLKNKTEIWKMNSVLKEFTGQAKKLIALRTDQANKEKQLLLQKLQKLDLMTDKAGLDDVLTLNLRDVLERRLQTLVFRKNLARSVRQARQFIIHEHIKIGDRIVSSPAYLVSEGEEAGISFTPKSKLSNADHPMRVEKKPSKEKIEVKKPEVKKEKTQKEQHGKKE
ncbi:30S ribosomal protein S4 [Candidatus Woesearchaeota archaeon]|nr:30S ribosomal protein S4 [Candidatus Woesearchaeota archaeon]